MEPASKKRIVLAVYLDLILFLVVWGYLEHFFMQGQPPPFWSSWVLFGLVEAGLVSMGGSPGRLMLGIDKARRVDAQRLARENWLTLLLGVLFVMEGTKQLTRWMQYNVPEPFFGFVPPPAMNALLEAGAGLWFIACGALYLMLHRHALLMTGTAIVITTLSCLLSWPLWDATVAELVSARRAARGMPVREGEIELAQAMMPEGILVAALLTLVALLFTRRRLQGPQAGQPSPIGDTP